MSKTQYAEPTVSATHHETSFQPDNGTGVYFVNKVPSWLSEMTVGNFSRLVGQMALGSSSGEEVLKALAA